MEKNIEVKKLCYNQNSYSLEIEKGETYCYFKCFKFIEDDDGDEKKTMFSTYVKWDGCWELNSDFHLCDFDPEFNDFLLILNEINSYIKDNLKMDK